MKLPKIIYIEPKIKEELINNKDCLSGTYTIFRHGGKTSEGRSIPFVELTPEINDFLLSKGMEK